MVSSVWIGYLEYILFSYRFFSSNDASFGFLRGINLQLRIVLILCLYFGASVSALPCNTCGAEGVAKVRCAVFDLKA